MKKYKFIGLNREARTKLCKDDLDALEEMIGCTVYESNNIAEVDGKKLFIMPDGVETHIAFLELEEIQEELPLNK